MPFHSGFESCTILIVNDFLCKLPCQKISHYATSIWGESKASIRVGPWLESYPMPERGASSSLLPCNLKSHDTHPDDWSCEEANNLLLAHRACRHMWTARDVCDKHGNCPHSSAEGIKVLMGVWVRVEGGELGILGSLKEGCSGPPFF